MQLNLGFQEFSEWTESHFGIYLSSEKWALVQTRIGSRLQKWGVQDLRAYLQILKSDPSEVKICIESLTTHKTEWFREIVHFQWLKAILEQKLQRQEKIRIWSAACSTGPEVYSLLLLCLKVGIDPENIRILGTDLSHRAIEEAMAIPSGEHFAHHCERLKAQCPSSRNLDLLVTRALQESIKFRQFNLVSDRLPESLEFDVIFLRNVMIYFTRERMEMVCQRLTERLAPGGHLVLGLSESLNQMIPELVPIGNSVYRLNGGEASAPVPVPEAPAPTPQKNSKPRVRAHRRVDLKDFDLIAIGSSTGGTEVVKFLLAGIPHDSPPIVVVQHMPGNFTEAFASRLELQTGRPTQEVREPVELRSGHAYLAAGGTHLTVEKKGIQFFAIPTDEPPVNRFKPSVSRLFGSMSELMIASRSIAIMLTGMGQDGAREMLRLKERGSFTLGQSEESCTVYGMPRAAAELGALSVQTSPEEMIEILGGFSRGLHKSG